MKRGRPKKNQALLSRDQILAEALKHLDENLIDYSPQALSMRALALRLEVSPMALYNHFSNRAELICALSDQVYHEVLKRYQGFSGSTLAQLEFLLIQYHQAVIEHPQLCMNIFESSKFFSLSVRKITQEIRLLICSLKIKKTRQTFWLNLLIDYTHGNAIALALHQINSKKQLKSAIKNYKSELKQIFPLMKIDSSKRF